MDIELSVKESEAIVWITAELIDFADVDDDDLDEQSAVRHLRMLGFSDEQIRAEGKILEELAFKRILPPALTTIQIEALKHAVEHTSWIDCYAEDSLRVAGPGALAEALEAIRLLATKLEERGVEIVQLAYGEYRQA
jgi:hypothetical protein